MVARRILRLTLPPPAIRPRTGQLLLVGLVLLVGVVISQLPLAQAALLVGGAILLALLLLEPILSLYLLIPLIPFSPLASARIGSFNIGLMEIMLALGAAAWLLKRLSGSPPPRPLEAGVLVWPFLLVLGGVGLSWLNTLSIGASLVETIKWVEMLVLYGLVFTALPRQQLKWVAAWLLLTGMLQAGLGLYQFLFKVGPEGFLLFGGRFLRAYGTFAQPNPYAGYLGLVLPLALALVLWAFFDAPPRRTALLGLALSSLAVLLAALAATQSRGAWLGFMAAGLAVLLLYNKKSAALVTVLILAGAVVGLAGAFDLSLPQVDTAYNAITRRLVDAAAIFTITDITTIEVTDANFATIERLAHWQAAGEMWRDNPWLGVGFGNYAVVYPAYAVGRWLNPLGHAHNYLLNIGAEAGLVGITAYLIFWFFVFGVLWPAVQGSRGFNRALATGVVGIMVHLHVHNLFDNLYVQGMYLHIATLLALVSIVYHGQKRGGCREE